MSPRFPQELFDHIIDYARYDDYNLKSYSTVCKRWSIRSRSHLFKTLLICRPIRLDQWCEGIPPTLDGPSRYVKELYVQMEVVPLVREPQPLDPYLDHFSALTQVVDLTLIGYRGKMHLDMIFQCFSGFKDTLCHLELTSVSFQEVSQIVEFFPNLEALIVWSPTSLRFVKEGPLQPHREAVFPRLKSLVFRLSSKAPALEHHLLSGFAEASMDLEALSIVGQVPDPSVIQQLLDSSAQSLAYLCTSPLELNLSACDNIHHIVVCNLLHSYTSSCYFHDSLTKPQFEHMLRTIRSPTLCAISVAVETRMMAPDEDEDVEDVLLPKCDWGDVDLLLCDLLVRVRARARNPLWTFRMRITGCMLFDDDILPDPKKFLPKFRAMGGTVQFTFVDD